MQRLLNGRLQYSISIYDMDWKNINSNQSVPVSTSPFLLAVVAPNDARLKGVEFEGRWLVTPEWDVGVIWFNGDDGVELHARNLFDDQHWTYIARSTSLAEPGALLLVRYPTAPSPTTTVQGLLLGAPEPRTIGLRVNYRS